jgi:tetratricopeptide (TPR) repeat protein
MKKVLVTILFSTILLLRLLAAGQAAPGSLDDQLLTAARTGDTAKVQQLLDKGANIEAKNEYGSTALVLAARDGQIEVVRLLLNKGANIEAKDKDDYTALLLSAIRGNTEVVKLLLDKGANIEGKERRGNTPLYAAASKGKVEVVKLLLDKGANIEATDNNGWTPLMKVASEGNPDMVKLLLDQGANIGAKEDSWGTTALMRATQSRDVLQVLVKQNPGDTAWTKKLSDQEEVIRIIERSLSNDPLANFAERISEFEGPPDSEARLEKVFKLTASLPTPPPIPEKARQLFIQASALIKQTSNPEELTEPINLLRQALAIAPWWGNAYYNLARALELSGQYDEAVKQLNYYLELKPSEADATDARAHIAVIKAEKQAAAVKKQQNESVLAVKYVSGGITRVRYNDVPAWWRPNSGHGVMDLYAYWVSEESPFFVNVFRMPNGYLLTISLLALSSNGAYTSDRIAVNAWNVTDGGCKGGFTFAFGEHSYTEPCGVHYDVSVSNQNGPNAFVSVTYTPTGAAVTLPIALLYRGRALKGNCTDGTVYQASHDKGGEVVHFDCSKVTAAQDSNVNALGLTPTTVAPAPK